MTALLRLSFTCVLLLAVSAAFAQYPTTLEIRVSGAEGPLPFASLSLVAIPDSAHRLNGTTDSLGRIQFQIVQGKTYRIVASSVGYQRYDQPFSSSADHPVLDIIMQLQQKNNTLGAVTVTATRPLMRQEDDKTIMDPESLALTSTNSYEILEKTPGIFIDQDGRVYLSSMTPATIYINGREQKMSAADVASLLKNLPPNAIASIEIMRTPSARYDASGSGGIVNIVLKKGVRLGLNGSLTGGWSQGRYGAGFAGLNISNNDGRLSTNVNLQYNSRGQFDKLKSDRFLSADSMLSQDNFTHYAGKSYFTSLSMVYSLKDHWDLGYEGRLAIANNLNRSDNLSNFVSRHSGAISRSTLSEFSTKAESFSLSQDVNLKYKNDSTRTEWTTDLSFDILPSNTHQDFTNTTTVPVSLKSFGQGDLDNHLHTITGETNYSHRFPSGITGETGLKFSHSWFDNDTRYTNGNGQPDLVRSGAYRYAETIGAAYLQASKSFGKILIKGGLRAESTDMKGHQLSPTDTSFSISRVDFFPYVYISRKLMEIAGYELRGYLVYRRSITRPAYENLNPAVRVVDPYLYETGNPSLRPQFVSNYEANISVNERPIFALGVNDSKDVFTQVVYPYAKDPTGKITARTYDNLGHNKETYFRVLGALPPGRKYFFVAGFQFNRNEYSGYYNNLPFTFNRSSYSVFTFHSLKIDPLTTFTLSGFARFNGQLQFYELGSFGALNLGLSHMFMQKKLTITASANDALYTNKNSFTINQNGINAAGQRASDSQRFNLNLRYNFGIRKKEESVNPFTINPDKVN